METAVQTAYSKHHKSRRKIYGSCENEREKNEEPLAISDFMETEDESNLLKNDCIVNDDSIFGQTTDEQPDFDSLIVSIDNLYVHADKENVTVKDIVQALEAEYQIKLAKKTKNFVREHLKDLVKGSVKPNVAQSTDDETEVSSESDNKDSDDEFEEGEDESSDFEDMEKPRKAKKGKTKGKKSVRTTRKSTRRVSKERKPSARQIMRKNFMEKRMEELRVRQEELQTQISKEDQERADKISARFNTDTDELRVKRLEDRLDLLQKLDLKRVKVIAGVFPKHESESIPPTASTSASESDSETDSDTELEIVGVHEEKQTEQKFSGGKCDELKSCVQSKALAILSQLDNKSTEPNKSSSSKRVSWSDAGKKKYQSSPGKRQTARAALRATLLSKQRKMGNMWLARELGYKSEIEHLRDCLQIEAGKRNLVIKKEEERIKLNERKQIRERLLLEQEDENMDNEDSENEPENTKVTENEEDEELVLAREIEHEHQEQIMVDALAQKDAPGAKDTQNETDKIVDQADEITDDNMTAAFSSCDVDTAVDEDDDKTVAFSCCDVDTAVDEDDDKTVAFSCCHVDNAVEEDDDKTVAFSCVDTGEDDYDKSQTDALPLNIETKSFYANSLVPERKEEVPLRFQDIKLPQLESEDEPKGSPRKKASEDSPSLDENIMAKEKGVDKAKPSNDSVDRVTVKTKGGDVKDTSEEEEHTAQVKREKNSAWKAMLQKEAERAKKLRKRQGGNLVEAEADEEEEEDVVAGLEDFGFALEKKKKESENEEEEADRLEDEDLKHVVDELSDDEGDEEEGERARKELMAREEKERHKEILRRMRDGYDGRRGGIASGGLGARGMHRFDQLVAADNRQDAKRLGLLNDDEIDSDDENEADSKLKGEKNDEVEDETLLLDKMLKDRFLHRSSVDMEENFSDDDDADEDDEEKVPSNDEETKEREQERLIAKRFAKRARMQRLIETHGDDKEFSQLRLLDEDDRMKKELTEMKDIVGKNRRQTSLTYSSRSSFSNSGGESQNGSANHANSQSSLATQSSSLFVALQANRQRKKTSFLGGSAASKEMVSAVHKSVALNHVVFHADNSQSKGEARCSQPSLPSKRKRKITGSTSLWEKVTSNSFRKKNRR